MKIRMIAGVFSAVMWMLFGATGALSQEVTLKVHHFLPPTSNLHAKFFVPWAEKVAKDSGGKLKLQLYPAMQLGGTAPQLLDQVRDGIVDIVWAAPGFTAGRAPAFAVMELPFMTKTGQGASRAFWEYVKQNKVDEREFKGMRLLAAHVHDEGFFHMVAKPIRTMADLKGMKIRAPSRTTTRLLAVLGATPIGMPLPQIPDALSKGVLDGALLPWEITPTIKAQELVKYHSEIDPKSRALYTTAFVLAMNSARYDALPPELRKVLDANSGQEVSAQLGKLWDDMAVPARKMAIDRGNQVNVIALAETKNWEKLGESVVEDWLKEVAAKGFDGRALLNSARDLLAKYDVNN